MKKNEFRISEVPPGSVLLTAMWRCSASKGVSCPLHGSQFNVRPGAVLRGRAKDPLKSYRVTVDGEVERADVPLELTVRSE
jgi:Rieske Fe-S protein